MKGKWQGILFCTAIAVPAMLLGKQWPVIGGPVFAILLGIVIGMTGVVRPIMKPGITFTSKKVLQYAVILLGFGLNLKTVISVGTTSLPIILSTITVALLTAFLLAKVLRIPSDIATLVGVGSSICGGSAIAATAPVINAEDEDIAQAISVIFFFNVIAALIFPTLGQMFGFTNEGFAIFAGTAVNDTSSVTAAASAWDAVHGTGTQVLNGATIVKLTRTLAIIPITVFLAIYTAKKQEGPREKLRITKVFPTFIAWFILASLVTTGVDAVASAGHLSVWAGEIIGNVFGFLKQASKFFIIMAMAAIGIHTDVVKLVKTGVKPLFMGFCCWIAISGISILLQKVLGIF